MRRMGVLWFVACCCCGHLFWAAYDEGIARAAHGEDIVRAVFHLVFGVALTVAVWAEAIGVRRAGR